MNGDFMEEGIEYRDEIPGSETAGKEYQEKKFAGDPPPPIREPRRVELLKCPGCGLGREDLWYLPDRGPGLCLECFNGAGFTFCSSCRLPFRVESLQGGECLPCRERLGR
jgi:hypothetical protein